MSTYQHVLKSKVEKIEDKLGALDDTENVMDLYDEILDKSRYFSLVSKHTAEQLKKEQKNAGKRTRRKITNKTR